MEQLATKIVDDFLVRLQGGRPFPGCNGVGDGWGDTGLHGELAMGGPFVLSGPVARGDDDGKLSLFGGQRRVEAELRAEFLRHVAHFRTAQQYVERAVHTAALAREQVLHHGLLFWRQLVIGEGLEAIAAEVEIARSGSLRVGHTHQAYNAGDY